MSSTANPHGRRDFKNSGVKVPDDVRAYLKTFSSAIVVERSSIREWVRSIMTDIQLILNRSGVEFIDVKKYSHEDCQEFEKAYSHILDEFSKNKPKHLIDHDVWALQMTRDAMVNKGDHYLISQGHPEPGPSMPVKKITGLPPAVWAASRAAIRRTAS